MISQIQSITERPLQLKFWSNGISDGFLTVLPGMWPWVIAWPFEWMGWTKYPITIVMDDI